MSQQILITGATGNVGSEVVKILQQQGQALKIAAHVPAKAQQIFGDKAGLEYLPFDFKQPETFPPALQNVKKIFLVRPPDVSDSKKYVDPFIEAAKLAGVEQIVFLSLLGVEKNKVVPHYKIEQSIINSGIDWTFLRASFFMQNLATTHREEIKFQNEIFVPAGRGKTGFIDVRDIAAVAAKALSEEGHRHQAYPLTGNAALSYYEVAKEFSEILGRPVRYSNPSPLKFIWSKFRQKLPLSFIVVMTGIYLTARFGMAATVTPDTERLLGRKPITVRQFIEDYKHYWM
jgi:uncharacterized protein YbjT (DUF2867 family)